MTDNLRFTEDLRHAAGEQWDRIVNHKFTRELAAGTIDRAVLKKYLIQDHRFLDAFVVLLSTIISKVHCLEDRIPGCQFLAVITGKENTYFERSFEKLGVSQQERTETETPNDPCTTRFITLMRSTALEGSLR
jgi:thiaminase/transcriptional activator TenA